MPGLYLARKVRNGKLHWAIMSKVKQNYFNLAMINKVYLTQSNLPYFKLNLRRWIFPLCAVPRKCEPRFTPVMCVTHVHWVRRWVAEILKLCSGYVHTIHLSDYFFVSADKGTHPRWGYPFSLVATLPKTKFFQGFVCHKFALFLSYFADRYDKADVVSCILTR